MVAGHHLMWSVYGWWLPNDPRGSMSTTVRVAALADLGEHYYGRKPVQPPRTELRAFHQEARQVLKHPVLAMTDEEIDLVGTVLGMAMARLGYTCYECAIMPDHLHLLIRKHRHSAEQMLEELQEATRAALIAAGGRTSDHPVWGGLGWKRFQFTQEDMERIVRYIRKNPLERRMSPQKWPFVVPYDGWLPGIGASRRTDARR